MVQSAVSAVVKTTSVYLIHQYALWWAIQCTCSDWLTREVDRMLLTVLCILRYSTTIILNIHRKSIDSTDINMRESASYISCLAICVTPETDHGHMRKFQICLTLVV